MSDETAGDGRPASTRRRLLAATGAAGLGALAGCFGADQARYRFAVDLTARTPLPTAAGYDALPLGWANGFGDAEVADAVEAANAGVLRFPGGAAGNFYDPLDDRFLLAPLERAGADVVDRDAVDSTDAREAAVDAVNEFRTRLGDRIRASDAAEGPYGFEDYLAATESAGAERLLVVNLSTAPGDRDPVEHAAAWIRELADRGVAVDRFELGAELYGPAGFYGGLHDPETYVAAAERVAGVIRDRFPEAAVAAAGAPVGGPVVDPAIPGHHHRYNEALAGADFYDAVASQAYFRIGDGNGADDGRAVREASRAALERARARPDEWAASMAEQFDAPVWLTEAGSVTAPAYDGTVLQALAEVAYLLRWLDHAGTVPLYCKHRLFRRPFGTVRSTRGAGRSLFGTPLYDALAYVEQAVTAATHRVEARVETSAVVGSATAGDGASLLVRGLLDAEAEELYLPFVNPAGEERLVGLLPEGADLPDDRRGAMRWVGGSLSAGNTADEPRAVTPGAKSIKAGTAIQIPGNSTGVVSIGVE